MKEPVHGIERTDWKCSKVGLKKTELRARQHFVERTSGFTQVFSLSLVWIKKCGNFKSEEIQHVTFGEELSWSNLVDGHPQVRRRKEDKRQAEESLEFLQEQGTQRTSISCMCKANCGIFTWPKRRKIRVVNDVDMFYFSDVDVLGRTG